MPREIQRAQAQGIVTAALAGLTWLAPQIRETLTNQATEFIVTQGGRSIQELQRFVSDQLAGIAANEDRYREQINGAVRQIAANTQQAVSRARMRGDLSGDIMEWDSQQDGGRQVTITEGGGTHTRFTGKPFYNLPWKTHKQLKNRKQMKQHQHQNVQQAEV